MADTEEIGRQIGLQSSQIPQDWHIAFCVDAGGIWYRAEFIPNGRKVVLSISRSQLHDLVNVINSTEVYIN